MKAGKNNNAIKKQNSPQMPPRTQNHKPPTLSPMVKQFRQTNQTTPTSIINYKTSIDENRTLYESVISRDGYYGVLSTNDDGEEIFTPKGRNVRLVKILQEIDTNSLLFILEYDYKGEMLTHELPRKKLNARAILELAEFGVDVVDTNARVLVHHLLNQELKAPKVSQHNTLGWSVYKERKIFKHQTAIGIESEYVGDLEIAPIGTYEGWKLVVEDQVLGNVALEGALSFGLSAVVLGFIGDRVGISSMLIHIMGDSTQGKTTAAQLAISTAGKVDMRQNGLSTNWNSTLNAIMGNLRGNYGMPLLLDEASLANTENFSNVVYTLEAGKERGRMNKDLSVRKAASWATTVLSTGEHGLAGYCNRNTGIAIRLFEFGSIMWTKSAENADQIKSGIRLHAGHAAPILAQKLLELGEEQVFEIWADWRRRFVDENPNPDNFDERVSMKQAVITTASQISADALGLPLNVEAIFQFILNNDSENKEPRDIRERAFEYFKQQVGVNIGKFEQQDAEKKIISNPLQSEAMGTIIKTDVPQTNERPAGILREVIIDISAFKTMMQIGGFQDPGIILKGWKAMGMLVADENHLSVFRKLTSSAPSARNYCVKIFEPSDDPADTIRRKPKPEFATRRNIQSKSDDDNIFGD